MEPHLVVNGQSRPLGDAGAHLTLLEWLRAGGLTGGKEGCAEGECGACAVLVARPDADGSRWTAINACLAPVAALDGQEVITSEGLGQPGALHPVQQEMADRGGSQCGYCTPGFICSMAAEFYRRDRQANGAQPPEPGHDVDHEHGPNGFDLHALSGNLCRCTGYRPIRDAAYALGQPAEDDPMAARSQHPAPAAPATAIRHDDGSFVRPTSLAGVLELIAERPDARLLAGSTDWGVELNLRHARAPLTVAIDRLDELRQLDVRDDAVEIGAALSLTEIERGLDGQVPLLADLFPQFASRLIRNTATLGGNLGTGSPIGDSLPVLLALEAELVLASTRGERVVPLADYFTGYRQTLRRPDELIKIVRIPRPLAPISAFHKIAKRRFDDISSISVAFALALDGDAVRSIKIGLGGVAATPLRARATEELLTGGPWRADAVSAAAQTLEREGTPLDDHRASAAFRSAMLRQALLKFHAENPAPMMEVAR
jgi:xanthine dehydrogenase small subunit